MTRTDETDGPRKAATPSRRNDPEGTRRDILAVATEEFATHGLSGARVDAIAEKTRTTKRMIYYYFGSKEGLYIAVLEKAYSDIRAIESSMHLENLDPEQAIRRLVEFTFDYEGSHPNFVRLVSIENIHHAEYITQSKTLQNLNVAVIDTIAGILERGRATGVFRTAVEPVDLHMMISAFCFFRVSNRHTFGTIFRLDLDDPAIRDKHRRMAADAVVRYLKGD